MSWKLILVLIARVVLMIVEETRIPGRRQTNFRSIPPTSQSNFVHNVHWNLDQPFCGVGKIKLCSIEIWFANCWLTVLVCNSCTKYADRPVIIHDCTPDCRPVSCFLFFIGMDAWVTSQLNVSLIRNHVRG